MAGLLAERGPLPPTAGKGGNRELLAEFSYRLYGMYLAVLAARMAASRGDQAGQGDSPFLDRPQPRPATPSLGRLRRPPPRGCDPQPAAPPARGPAGLVVAPGLPLGLGQAGKGAGLDGGASAHTASQGEEGATPPQGVLA